MKKYKAMLDKKEADVKERILKINNVCNILMENNEEISYKKINELTGIPTKTLYNQRYKSIIQIWAQKKFEKEKNSESEIYLNEITYLKEVIKKLREQNNNLKLELYRKLR